MMERSDEPAQLQGLGTAKKEVCEAIRQMYRIQASEAETLDNMFSKLSKREMRLICKIARVANRIILYE